MVKKTSTQLVHVRMPKWLHQKIQREADRHGQTINAEVLNRLLISFETQRTLQQVESSLVKLGGSLDHLKLVLPPPLEISSAYVTFLAEHLNKSNDEILHILGEYRASEEKAQKRRGESDMQSAERRTEETVRLIEERGEKRKPQTNKTETGND